MAIVMSDDGESATRVRDLWRVLRDSSVRQTIDEAVRELTPFASPAALDEVRPTNTGPSAREEEQVTQAARDIRVRTGARVEWIERFQAGDRRAAAALVEAHEGLVRSIVQRIRPPSRDWEDCLQVGRIAILKAAEKHDLASNSTAYLCWWIRGQVKRFLIDRGSVVRIPAYRYSKTLASGKVNEDRAFVRQTRTYLFCQIADRFQPDDDDAFEVSLVSDDPMADEQLDVHMQEELVPVIARWFLEAVEGVDPVGALVLRKRFLEGQTLIEIGQEMERSRERIRQREVEALRRCEEMVHVYLDDTFETWLSRCIHTMEKTKMRGKKKTVFEWLLVVEGRGDFPFDMLRYDTCMPHEETDAHRIERAGERRRLVLCRRSVSDTTGTPERWRSFGWEVLAVTTDAHEARQLADQAL